MRFQKAAFPFAKGLGQEAHENVISPDALLVATNAVIDEAGRVCQRSPFDGVTDTVHSIPMNSAVVSAIGSVNGRLLIAAKDPDEPPIVVASGEASGYFYNADGHAEIIGDRLHGYRVSEYDIVRAVDVSSMTIPSSKDSLGNLLRPRSSFVCCTQEGVLATVEVAENYTAVTRLSHEGRVMWEVPGPELDAGGEVIGVTSDENNIFVVTNSGSSLLECHSFNANTGEKEGTVELDELYGEAAGLLQLTDGTTFIVTIKKMTWGSYLTVMKWQNGWVGATPVATYNESLVSVYPDVPMSGGSYQHKDVVPIATLGADEFYLWLAWIRYSVDPLDRLIDVRCFDIGTLAANGDLHRGCDPVDTSLTFSPATVTSPTSVAIVGTTRQGENPSFIVAAYRNGNADFWPETLTDFYSGWAGAVPAWAPNRVGRGFNVMPISNGWSRVSGSSSYRTVAYFPVIHSTDHHAMLLRVAHNRVEMATRLGTFSGCEARVGPLSQPVMTPNTAAEYVYRTLPILSASQGLDAPSTRLVILDEVGPSTLSMTAKNGAFHDGVFSEYDGHAVFENNFPYHPLLYSRTFHVEGGSVDYGFATGGSTGAQFWPTEVGPDVAAVYRFVDLNGQWHVSEPAIQLSPGIPNGLGIPAYYDVWVRPLSLSGKAASRCFIDLYARKVGVSQFQYVGSAPATASGDESWKKIRVGTFDAEAKILYTEGGVLSNAPAPAVYHATSTHDRVWAISAEDRRLVWISKINNSDQFAPAFALELIANTGEGACTGIATLDEKVLVFKRDKVLVYAGDPPNNLGVGATLVGPDAIAVHVGCSHKQSVGVFPDGVVFQSDDGIWLVTRNLDVVRISDPVKDYVSRVVGVAHMPSQSVIVFGQAGSHILVYNYRVKQWTTFVAKVSADDAELTAECRALAVGENYGRQVMLVAVEAMSSVRSVLKWPSRGSAEHGVTSGLSWTVSTGWFQFGGLAGWQRTRRITFVGKRAIPSAVSIVVKFFYDFETVAGDTLTLTSADVNNLWRGDSEMQTLTVQVPRGKSSAMRVQLEMSSELPVASCEWHHVVVEYGVKSGGWKTGSISKR